MAALHIHLAALGENSTTVITMVSPVVKKNECCETSTSEHMGVISHDRKKCHIKTKGRKDKIIMPHNIRESEYGVWC